MSVVPSLEESEPEVQQQELAQLGSQQPAPEEHSREPASLSSSRKRTGEEVGGQRRRSFGSGNFRRATRYYRPQFLMKASMRNLSRDRIRKASWHQEPAPDFCHEVILVHEECDDHHVRRVSKGTASRRQRQESSKIRWSFNLEDGNCYQYTDPCPLFKRNSFHSLSQCLATCWRQTIA